MTNEEFAAVVEYTAELLHLSNEEMAAITVEEYVAQRARKKELAAAAAAEAAEAAEAAKKAQAVLPSPEPTSWPVWMEIELGRYESAKAYIAALEAAGIKIVDMAKDILQRTPISKTIRKVRLVKIKVSDLGFTAGAPLSEIYLRAQNRGLDLCPAEVGPVVLLADHNLVVGEGYRIIMEPIIGSDGILYTFSVECCGDGRWLFGVYGIPGSKLPPDRSIVFCLREPLP